MIKEIWNTLTSGGKRSLLLSVTGFTLYALSGIAMMYIVLKSLESVMSGNGVLMWYTQKYHLSPEGVFAWLLYQRAFG